MLKRFKQMQGMMRKMGKFQKSMMKMGNKMAGGAEGKEGKPKKLSMKGLMRGFK